MSNDPIARMDLGLKLTTWLWSVGAVITAIIVFLLVNGSLAGQNRIRVEQYLFTAWTLGPPCWLVVQHRLWPPASTGYERFRLHQALVKAVWAGVIAFLAAIMFGRWG